MTETTDEERVLLGHGSGGGLSRRLIERVFLRAFGGQTSRCLDDFAVVESRAGRLAFTTDSFVVKPIFFRGGDIGRLAVCGTVNDLAMSGAKPMYLSASFIIEEGFLIVDLHNIVRSMQRAAEESGVEIITGDTKVVEAGKADRVFITTTGIGVIPTGVCISGAGARPGDKIVLSGPIGDHGIAVLSEREGFHFKAEIQSDCAPLNHLVEAMLGVCAHIRCLRDPTRGGLATVLNELADQSRVGMRVYEDAIPVRESVRAACDLLGYDPLYVANEGKLVAVIGPELAQTMVAEMKRHDCGREAAVIGEVVQGPAGRVTMVTRIGGSRIIDTLSGEMLPRIC